MSVRKFARFLGDNAECLFLTPYLSFLASQSLEIDSGSLSSDSRGSSLMRDSADVHRDSALPPRFAAHEDESLPPRQGRFDETTARWNFSPQPSRPNRTMVRDEKQHPGNGYRLAPPVAADDVFDTDPWADDGNHHETSRLLDSNKDLRSECSSGGSSDDSSKDAPSDSEVPPLLAHLSGDPVALRQWASVAVAELQALRLGEKHQQLHITALATENERLERELRNAVAAKNQVRFKCVSVLSNASDVCTFLDFPPPRVCASPQLKISVFHFALFPFVFIRLLSFIPPIIHLQAEEMAMLLRARSSGPGPQQMQQSSSSSSSPLPPTNSLNSLTSEALALPLLRGQLLEEAQQKLEKCERAVWQSGREVTCLKTALMQERKKARSEGKALRNEVKCENNNKGWVVMG